MAYRKFEGLEAEVLENIGCQEEMDDVLSQYELQVFKVTSNYEDHYSVSFYLADCTANDLTAELNADNEISDFVFAEWRTTRMK
tara:strand:+ start:498 stop:749 length:252 start_codon:yes stop_codon:yes gene_type:complete